jgi:hypothetical protein
MIARNLKKSLYTKKWENGILFLEAEIFKGLLEPV